MARRIGSERSQVSVEKVHVTVLAERIEELLDQLADADAGVLAAVGSADNAPLDTPIEEEYRVQALSLAWDEGRRVIVIECHDHDPDEVSDTAALTSADTNSLRVVLSPPQARAFARRCTTVASAGRPSCPFCGGPLDPSGHICPRANGYRR